MTILSRWLAPAVLAAGFGFGAMAPMPAQAQHHDDLARVIVDVADVIFRSGQPYYRYSDRYGYDDRLIVVHDRYRRPVYYRQVPRTVYYRETYRNPPYGVAHGYYGRDGRWWDGRRWHDRRDYDDRRRWQSRNDWRDRDHDRHDRDWDKRKNNHGRGRGHDRDRD